MEPTFRNDDLNRLRDVERGVAECQSTLAGHSIVLDHQSAALERIEKSLEKVTALADRVQSLESTRSTWKSIGKWTATVAGVVVAAALIVLLGLKQ